MDTCINKNSALFQTLKQRSGLSEFVLEATCRGFIERHNRWPNLDELPNADSTKSLYEALNMDKDGFTKTQTILDYFGKSTIDEAIIEANKLFSDLEISILQIGNGAIVKAIRRPNEYNFDKVEKVDIKLDINFPVYINFLLQKLSNLYGIKIIPISTSDLIYDKQFSEFPIDALSNRGFIYNGNIYLNTDNLKADTPVHELLHLFFGSIRFSDPELYTKLVSIAESFKSYNRLSKYFLNRTKLDLNEELFIQEFSKYITGLSSEIEGIDQDTLFDINYNVNRVLDSMLMGQHSVRILDSEKYAMSMRLIASIVNSSELNGSSHSSLTDATIHRILANTKSDLMSKGELKEYC